MAGGTLRTVGKSGSMFLPRAAPLDRQIRAIDCKRLSHEPRLFVIDIKSVRTTNLIEGCDDAEHGSRR
jgi:hypothetical protein